MKARIIELPHITDERGDLSFFESNNHIPFSIVCSSVLNNISLAKESGIAYKNNDEFIIALSGKLNLIVDDGNMKSDFCLDKPNLGLFVPRMYWRNFVKASENCVLLVVGSQLFDDDDCIHQYDEFLKCLFK